MKILLLGSGAREHALAHALARDPQTTELVVAPGNPGTSAIATNFSIDPCAPEEVVALATQMGRPRRRRPRGAPGGRCRRRRARRRDPLLRPRR